MLGHCSVCSRKESTTVNGNTIASDCLGDFFESPAIRGFNASKQMAENVLKNSKRASEVGANVGTAFESPCPKADLSGLPEVIIFHHTGKRFYLGKFV